MNELYGNDDGNYKYCDYNDDDDDAQNGPLLV